MSSPIPPSLEDQIIWVQQQVNYYVVMKWEPDRTLSSSVLDTLRALQRTRRLPFPVSEDKPEALGC